MTRRLHRRDMLRNTAFAGIGLWITGNRTLSAAPSQRLNIAMIGPGGRGAENLAAIAHENIVAICDVDDQRAGNAYQQFPNARKFHDYRKMLDEMDRQIDAVLVSTPDHTHAVISMKALKMGKHVYCEKPLTHNVVEARLVAETAAKHKAVTQMGTQIHAEPNYRRCVELVRSGAIGPVRECLVWIGGARTADERTPGNPPVPEHLQWDLWLGPARQRPYSPDYVPYKWRFWWDFGTGEAGNFGCHYIDLPFWALDLRYPLTVETEGPPVHPDNTPKPLVVRWQFPARGEQPPVKLTWYQDQGCPPAAQEKGVPADWRSGILFVGDRGMLLADYSRRKLLPESQFADFTAPAPTIADSIGHHREWTEACKTGGATTCNFVYSGALTETVLLGNVAFRTQTKIEWDPVHLKATNCPEAERFLRETYREGWSL